MLDFHLVSGFLRVFRRSQRTPLVKRRRQFLGANVSEIWMFCLLKNLKSMTSWHVFSTETLGCFLDNVDLSWHVLPVAICPCSFEKTVIISVMVCIGGMKLWKILSFFRGRRSRI